MSDLLEMIGDDHPIASTLQAKGIDTVDALANQYAEALKVVGRKTIPDSNSSESDWAEFRSKLGVPDSPDGYEAEGSVAEALRGAAHEAGVTPEQFSKIAGATEAIFKEQQDGATEKRKKLHETLAAQAKEKFGDQYEEKLAAAKRSFESLMGDQAELAAQLEETGFTSHPAIIDAFARLEKLTGDHAMPEDGDSGELTQQQQDAKIIDMLDRANEIVGHEGFSRRNHNEYRKLQTEFSRIQKALIELGIRDEDGGVLTSRKAEEIRNRNL